MNSCPHPRRLRPARQQDLEADLGKEGQPNGQQVPELVHQQLQGVDGEDLLPTTAAGCAGAVQSGTRGSSRGTARAPDAFREIGDHGANWFECFL